MKRAVTRSGEREFVEGPLPVRVVKRTLIVDGTADDDAITLARRFVTLNGESFNVKGYDRVRVDGGDGLDTLATDAGHVYAAGDRVRLGDAEFDNVDILRLQGDATVGDLSATDTFQVDVLGADRATVLGSEDDDQISIGSFGDPRPDVRARRRSAADRPADRRRPRWRRHHQRLDRDDGADARRRQRRQRAARRPGRRPADRRQRLRRRPRRQGLGRGVAGRRLRPLQLEPRRRQRRRRRRRQPRLALVPGHERGGGVHARRWPSRPATATRSRSAGLEEINAVAGGGADTFAIGDLRRTGVATRRHQPGPNPDHGRRRRPSRPRARSPAPTRPTP